MTIITFRDGIMAANSAFSSGGMIDTLPPGASKLTRLQNGGVLGVAGTYGYQPLLAEAISRKEYTELIGSRFLMKATEGGDWCLLYAIEGKLIYASNENPPHYTRQPYAVGSGDEFAMGALAMGASATEAAKVAAKLSTTCGGKIVAMEVPGWNSRKKSKPEA